MSFRLGSGLFSPPDIGTEVPLTTSPWSSRCLETCHSRLVKLIDFRLARKSHWHPDVAWVSAPCGSELYTAPQLLVALAVHTDEQPLPTLPCASSDAQRASSSSATSQPESRAARRPGTYGVCETDMWLLGVAVFTLTTRVLPFDPPSALDVPLADGVGHTCRWRVLRGVTFACPYLSQATRVVVEGWQRKEEGWVASRRCAVGGIVDAPSARAILGAPTFPSSA